MAKVSKPIFKAHNPGCNCCPEQDEGTPDCITLYLVEPFVWVNSFLWDTTGAQWNIFGNPATGLSSKVAPQYYGNVVIFPSVPDGIANWWRTGGTWTVEGVSELYGGSNINGSVTPYPLGESAGGNWIGFHSSAGPSELCPFGSGYFGNLYPLFQDTQVSDYYSPFGVCYPAWESGTSARARFSTPMWMRANASVIPNLEEGVAGTMRVGIPDEGFYGNGLYHPDVYWPFTECLE
jgi:hypothetical protein